MVTDPASAIKREVFQLVERQIDTLRRKGCLTASDLVDYHTRSEKIRSPLCAALGHRNYDGFKAESKFRSLSVLRTRPQMELRVPWPQAAQLANY